MSERASAGDAMRALAKRADETGWSFDDGVAGAPGDAEPLRERVADELERQIMEDFRNPRLGAPDIDGKIPRDLMLERADTVLALLRSTTPSAAPSEPMEHMMDGYLVMEQIGSGQRRHIGISTVPDDRTPEGERVRVFRLAGTPSPARELSQLRVRVQQDADELRRIAGAPDFTDGSARKLREMSDRLYVYAAAPQDTREAPAPKVTP